MFYNKKYIKYNGYGRRGTAWKVLDIHQPAVAAVQYQKHALFYVYGITALFFTHNCYEKWIYKNTVVIPYTVWQYFPGCFLYIKFQPVQVGN